MKFPTQVFLLVATFALVAGACSTDDASVAIDAESAEPAQASQDSAERSESEPDSEAEPETATAPTATPEPASPAPQDDQVEDTDQASEADAPADFDGGGSGDWCEFVRALEAEADEGLDDRVTSGDPVQLEAYYQEQREGLNTMQRLLPPELASDMAIVFETNFRLLDALEAVEWEVARLDDLDSPEIDAEAEAEALDQALTNFEDYNFQVCGIER